MSQFIFTEKRLLEIVKAAVNDAFSTDRSNGTEP